MSVAKFVPEIFIAGAQKMVYLQLLLDHRCRCDQAANYLNMAAKRKKNSDQPDLPIPELPQDNGNPPKRKPAKNGNGETHVLAEDVAAPVPHVFKPGKI